MAFRQNYMRGRFANRSRYYRRGTGTRFVAKRYTNRVNGREVPYYVGAGVEAHVADTPLLIQVGGAGTQTIVDVTSLNLIPRGTGIFERESQRASMKYLLLRARSSLEGVTFATAGSWLKTQPMTVRFILLYSVRAVAAAPPVSDFLTSPGGNDLYATTGVQRIDSRENYQILYDNKFVLRNTNGSFTNQINQPLYPEGDFTFKDLDVRIPLNRPVSFTSTSISPITVSDITSGHLALYVLYDGLWSGVTNQIRAATIGSVRLVFSP